MTLEYVPPHLIDPNPWQTRLRLRPEHVTEIAESIYLHGLQQYPAGRRVGDRVQLKFGHTRHAAWIQALGDQPMPIDVEDLTDRQMAEHAAIENGHRADLSAIEKASTIQRLQTDFDMTQVEAGALVGIRTQGAVSNILSLLKLPQATQDLVDARTLPERLARALLPVATIDPGACDAIAAAVAKAHENAREDTLHTRIRAFAQRGEWMGHSVPWPLDWPKEPISVDIKGLSEAPACKPCPFFFVIEGDRRYCLREVCFKTKHELWAQREAERVAKKLGLGVQSPGEKGTPIYTGEYGQQERAQLALKLKHVSLRVAVVPKSERGEYRYGSPYDRESVLGSGLVELRTVDARALNQALAALPRSKAAPRKIDAWEAKQKKEQAERAARKKQTRNLVSSAAPAFVSLLPDPLVPVLAEALRFTMFVGKSAKVKEAWNKASAAHKKELLMRALLEEHTGVVSSMPPALDKTRKKLVDLAKATHIRLPPGWDAAPSAAVSRPKSAPAKPPKRHPSNSPNPLLKKRSRA
jgi:ParB/RepB/Spo0J family partition protein